MNKTCILFFGILFSALTAVSAQENAPDSNRVDKYAQPLAPLPWGIDFDFSFGGHMPGGDLAKRFYAFGSVGGAAQLIIGQNWLIGGHFDYQFGEDVKIDVLAPLRASTGEIINADGNLSDAQLGQRGYAYGLKVGKIFAFNPRKNRRSGIETSLGLGYWQHWVRIRVTDEQIFQLLDDYRRGYDRLTTGLQLKQFVGYRYFSRGGYTNFFAGIELAEGFTKNRRPMNFDTRQTEDQARFDFAWGFRVGVHLPFFVFNPNADQGEVRFY